MPDKYEPKITFSTAKIEKAAKKFSDGMRSLGKEIKDATKKVVPKIVQRMDRMRKLTRQLESAGAVVNTETYNARIKLFDDILDCCSKLRDSIEGVQEQKVSLGVADVRAVRNKKEKTAGVKIQAPRPLKEIKGVGEKLSKMQDEVTATETAVQKDRKALVDLWKEAKKEGTKPIGVDSAITDILEKTSKKLSIAMPDKQTFEAMVHFKSIPTAEEDAFESAATKILREETQFALKNVKDDVAARLQKFDNAFQRADQKGNETAAEAVFDNINDMLSKLPAELERLMKLAAEKTLKRLKSAGARYSELMDHTNTQLAKVEVKTKFFSVELVKKDGNPAETLTAAFEDGKKDFDEHANAFQSTAEDTQREWSSLAETLSTMTKEIDELGDDLDEVQPVEGTDEQFRNAVKKETRSRSRTIDTLAKHVTTLKTLQDKLSTSRKELSTLTEKLKKEFEAEAKKLRGNESVSKPKTDSMRQAIKTLAALIAQSGKLQKTINALNTDQQKFSALRRKVPQFLLAKDIGKAGVGKEKLEKQLVTLKEEIKPLISTAETHGRNVIKALSIASAVSGLEKAAGELKK